MYKRQLDIRTQKEGELSTLRSELYKITVILTEQKEQLAGDKNQMVDFLGDIAHQLRTPLSAILLQTELWQDPAVSLGEKSECVFRIQQETERMGWLVEELLKPVSYTHLSWPVHWEFRQCSVFPK